jgi:hypothetical protein
MYIKLIKNFRTKTIKILTKFRIIQQNILMKITNHIKLLKRKTKMMIVYL